ncbi:unnamed protein product [Colias eurytheme]|nr:unnamed protein product [Colias eurytheme]
MPPPHALPCGPNCRNGYCAPHCYFASLPPLPPHLQTYSPPPYSTPPGQNQPPYDCYPPQYPPHMPPQYPPHMQPEYPPHMPLPPQYPPNMQPYPPHLHPRNDVPDAMRR